MPTGYASSRFCYAAQLGDCSGQISREHFLSKSILQEFEEAGKLNVIGYPHGNEAGSLLLTAESMSAKVLCEGHNSRLSVVDSEGTRFVMSFFDAHLGLLDEKFECNTAYEIDGPLVERWMLKYTLGLIASGNAGVGAERIQKSAPPLGFLEALFGIETFPDRWGLYTRPTHAIGVSDRRNLGLGLYLPRQASGAYHVHGLRMHHYGFTSILALTTPQESFDGSDLEGSFRHPEFFRFVYAPTGREAVIQVNWPEPKIGSGFVINLQKGYPPE